MRKNRRRPARLSVVAATTMRFASFIMLGFVMVILYWLSSSSCTQLLNAKGEKEKELARLENSLKREEMRWEGMLTPEKIERALVKHGLAMKPTRPDQIVRLGADGTPVLGQISVTRAKQRCERALAMGTQDAVRRDGDVRPRARRVRRR